MPEVARSPGRIVARFADVEILEFLEEELEDKEPYDGGEEGVHKKEERQGDGERVVLLWSSRRVRLCSYQVLQNIQSYVLLPEVHVLTVAIPTKPSALNTLPAQA